MAWREPKETPQTSVFAGLVPVRRRGSPSGNCIARAAEAERAGLDAIPIVMVTNFFIGAVVAFTGLCRDDGGTLAALELEHYPGMTEKKLAEVE